jgi:hypothetical protein
MTRKNFYVLVDKQLKKVINHPIELPVNWNNIHNMPSLSDEELSDLEWAGQPNLGWIKFDEEFPDTYGFADSWELFAKETIKGTYAKYRWEAESKGIEYKNVNIETNERTKMTLLIKKESLGDKTFLWKYNNTAIEFNLEDVTNILTYMNDYIQKCFDVEASLIQQLNLIKTPEDLKTFTLEIEWPSNVY